MRNYSLEFRETPIPNLNLGSLQLQEEKAADDSKQASDSKQSTKTKSHGACFRGAKKREVVAFKPCFWDSHGHLVDHLRKDLLD